MSGAVVQPAYRSTPWEQGAEGGAAGPRAAAKVALVSESGICRGPLAAAALAAALRRRGLGGQVECECRATQGYCVGEGAHPAAAAVAAELGLELPQGYAAQQFKEARDIVEYDVVRPFIRFHVCLTASLLLVAVVAGRAHAPRLRGACARSHRTLASPRAPTPRPPTSLLLLCPAQLLVVDKFTAADVLREVRPAVWPHFGCSAGARSAAAAHALPCYTAAATRVCPALCVVFCPWHARRVSFTMQVSVFDTIKSWGLGPTYSSKVRRPQQRPPAPPLCCAAAALEQRPAAAPPPARRLQACRSLATAGCHGKRVRARARLSRRCAAWASSTRQSLPRRQQPTQRQETLRIRCMVS